MLSQSGSPQWSHPGSAIDSHPAERERVPQVGALPDPVLSLGIQNDGFKEIQIGKMETSYYEIGLSQGIPWPGKRGLRTDVARIAADEATLVSRSRSAQTTEQQVTQQAKFAVRGQVAARDRKLIQNAELGLMVRDVRAAAEGIRTLTELNHGEIDKLEIIETSGGFLSATLLVRVPASINGEFAFR